MERASRERAGFVLVGGKSSRMGRDKALLAYGGATLVQHVAKRVAAAAGCATLVGSPQKYGGLGYPVIPDMREGAGPAAGIEAALRATCAEWNLVVACDMPGVTVDFLSALLEEARRTGADCLLPLSGQGRAEPLCAVYRRSALQAFEAALAAGICKITRAIEGLRVVAWPAPRSTWFANVNTPELN